MHSITDLKPSEEPPKTRAAADVSLFHYLVEKRGLIQRTSSIEATNAFGIENSHA
jgi:hypothetical protein